MTLLETSNQFLRKFVGFVLLVFLLLFLCSNLPDFPTYEYYLSTSINFNLFFIFKIMAKVDCRSLWFLEIYTNNLLFLQQHWNFSRITIGFHFDEWLILRRVMPEMGHLTVIFVVEDEAIVVPSSPHDSVIDTAFWETTFCWVICASCHQLSIIVPSLSDEQEIVFE